MLRKTAPTVVTLLGVAFFLALSVVAVDAWFNNTMGEYYGPADVWATIEWGYGAQLVLILTAVFFAVAVVLAVVGAALVRLFGSGGRERA